MEASTHITKLWNKNFIGSSLASFFVFLVFYYLLVTMPAYSLLKMDATKIQAGLLVTVFLFSAIIIRPFTGKWLEMFGMKRMLLISLLIFVGSTVMYLFQNSMNTLLIVRFIHGIGFGMATTASGGIVANSIPENRRAEGMGYYTLAANMAVVAGPFTGLTVLQSGDRKDLFIVAIFLSVLALVSAIFIKIPQLANNSSDQKQVITKGSFLERKALRISIVAGLFAVVYSSIVAFVSVYAEEIGLFEVSAYFFVFYAAAMLVSRPFTGRWSDRFGTGLLVFPAIFILAIGMFILSQSSSAWVFLLASVFLGLGWGTLFSNFQTLAVEYVLPQKRGLAMATFLSIFDTGIALGTFLVGFILTVINLSSFYFYGSIVILFGLLLYYFVYYKPVKEGLYKK